MSLPGFVVTTIAISVSGVLSPGPVTAVTIGHGARNKNAGVLVALGHAVVELPLILLVMVGVDTVLNHRMVHMGLGLAGGACLVWMGACMLRTARDADWTVGAGPSLRKPLSAGILLSAMNPYFYLWWISVGLSMIVQARAFGLTGVALLVAVHWLCDLIFLWGMSAVSFKGGRLFGRGFQTAAFIVCGLALTGFGAKFVIDAVRALIG